MRLSDIIGPERIIHEMPAKDRWIAIRDLLDLLISTGQIKPEDREVVHGLLKARETTMSTGIGFGVAIPHATTDRITKVVAAFGRSAKGIEFEALDGQPVHYVLMFLVPKAEFQIHLRMLATIAKFLNDKKTREMLDNAKSVEDLSRCFEVNLPES